jgi:hypothetical protein
MQEVRAHTPGPESSGAIDIPGTSSHLMHAHYGSGQSHSSPVRPFSVLSASSAAPYMASGRSSFDEGRMTSDVLSHMQSMHARKSSGITGTDVRDESRLNMFLSSELEAARSELSSIHGVNSPVWRSPGNQLMGVSPQGGGHFGGYFRGASAGSAAAPGGNGGREEISAVAPKVMEGSERVQVFQTPTHSPMSPGRLEAGGLR